MKLFDNIISNKILLFICAVGVIAFSVFSGLFLESKSLYENVKFVRDNGFAFGLQKIESDDAIHLFCANSNALDENLLFEGNGGKITFTLADGTIQKYESGDKINTDVLEAAVFCKIFWGNNIFAYANDFSFHKWEGLPTISIALKRGSLEDISDAKGLWSSADYSVWDAKGNEISDSNCDVKVHGNTTFFYPEKSFDIKMDEATPLLNMEGAKRWVLVSGYDDPSFTKDAVAYSIQQKMGCEYATEMQFVNVYVNDEFQGLYWLVQKPEGGSIPTTFKDNKKEDFYLLELCGLLVYLEDPNRIDTDRRYIKVRYPDALGDKLYDLADYVKEAESALYMDNGEAENAYLSYFDTESFAIHYLIHDFLKNYEAELCSQYVYFSKGEKIKSGPAWDFGGSMDMTYDTPLHGADLLHIKAMKEYPKVEDNMWFQELDCHEDFHAYLKELYIKEFYPKAKQAVSEFKENTVEEIRAAADLDNYMWGASEQSFTENMEYTTDWMMNRLDFLYEYYSHEEEYCLVTFKTQLRYDSIYPVKRGTGLGWIPDEGTWKDNSGICAEKEMIIDRDIVFYNIEEEQEAQ